METRSRKRAEAAGQRPPPPAQSARPKRARLSAPAAPASAAPTPPRPRTTIRSSSASGLAAAATFSFQEPSMDSGMESSTSASKRDSDKGLKREQEKEDDQGLGKSIRGAEKEKETEKRKEKEMEKEKEKVRDRDRPGGASGGGDEENEAEGNSSLHQNLASASSALHGLLRKLGAGLDDLLPSPSPSSHQSSRLKRILSGLRAEGEEGRQLEALSQLCELLSIGTEESLSSFSVDSFVPVLVGLLNHEYNPDIMLLAARALTHLCDVLPSSCAAVVHYGAVPCLCARLLTIEYIDLAEQSLQALEKISHEHPTACLRAGALVAVLSYLDFFSTGVQRVAVSTAANICRQLPSDASDFVMEAVPILSNLLQYHDSKVVEHASVCLTRIAESFASSSEKLDMLCAHGLIPQAARLISVGNSTGGIVLQASLSNSTYTGLIRLLSTCVSGSAAAAESLLLLNISSILKDILAGSGLVASILVSPSAVNRPPEQLHEIVTLANELLPPMPQPAALPNGVILSRSTTRKPSTGGSSTKADDGNMSDISAREKLLREQPELLVQFGADLFPVLVQVYGSSVNPPVRHKCLAAISKLVHFSTAEMLGPLLKELNISSFLAGVLASKDPSILIAALQIAEMLMHKLPDIFRKLFVKEGVVHAIDALIAYDQGGTSSHHTSPSGRAVDGSLNTTAGTPPSRSRRNSRRRSGGSNGETAPEDLKGSSSAPVGSPPSGSGPEASVQTVKTGLRCAVISAAKNLKETYFPGDSGLTDTGVTESLCKLKALCAKLNGDCFLENKGKWKGKGKAAADEQQILTAVGDILAELGRGDGVSTFEFVGSGVVSSLLNYFACGSQGKDNGADANLDRRQQHALKRFKQFIAMALPTNSEQETEAPLTILVRKLQNALASLERFPVILSNAPRSGAGNASIAAGLSALAQPFKLRLLRAPGERSLRDYSSNSVLIDPLANLVSIEEYLWPRVQRADVSQKSSALLGSSDAGGAPATAPVASPSTSAPNSIERRHSTRSRSIAVASAAVVGPSKDSDGGTNASTLKGKGKVGNRGSAEEHKGPETRTAAARRRAAAANSSLTLKQSHDSGSAAGNEDDDVDISPVELDEAVAMEEDDLSEEEEEEEHEEVRLVFGEENTPLCIGERVHDVRLGDSLDMGAVASTSATTAETPSQPSAFGSGVAGIQLGGRAAILTGLETGESRSGGPLGSKNSLSFAAAAMAGLASGKGFRAGRERRSLATIASSNVPSRLVFSLGGKPLNRSLTIFQAIQRQAVADEDDEERYAGPDYSLGEGRRLWDELYTITYQRADPSSEKICTGASSSTSPKPLTGSQNKMGGVGSSSSSTESSWQQASLLDNVLQGELPCDLDKSNSTYNILLLLRVLEGLNRLAPRLRTQVASDAFAEGKIGYISEMKIVGPLVPQEDFLSSKLTPKLARQMQDALALCSGGLPAWCHQLTRACPFLFPFETRRQYFHSTAFGLTRALQRLQQQQSADNPVTSNDRELRVGRLQRQKVRVSRSRILDSAVKVMELYSGHKAVLEVEYFGEVGTGLGPTLEFYTLLSHDLQRTSLEMWRTSTAPGSTQKTTQGDIDMQDVDSDSLEEGPLAVGANGVSNQLSTDNREYISIEPTSENGDYVHAPYGLFPRPWSPNTDASGDSNASGDSKYGKVIEHFRLLGRTMAKALQDGRLMDLSFSTAFCKLVLGQELDLYDVKSFDPELGTTLEEMQNLVRRKQFLESSLGDSRQAVSALRFRDVKIEDLCLDFTLPGYPDYLLKPGGSNIIVDINNLEEYVSLVVEATSKTGISAQMEAFRAGFNQVFQLSTLQIFSDEELDYLLCGRRELWVPETLSEHMKFDHGYTASSPPIRNLLEIMGELTPEQQRAFLRFVTGAPRLPPGGLAALNPRLTIVRKHPTGMSGAAAVLGSTPPGVSSALGTTMADGDLPSVMTCANYLKLPPYSCKEVMRERLLYALCEGQGSFDLS